MTDVVKNKDEILYACPECGLHYPDAQAAKQCEAWCQEHRSCNLEITRAAVENKAGSRKSN